MQGPRIPRQDEYSQLVTFLNSSLRPTNSWSIADEYPTALTPRNIHNMRIISDGEKVLSHALLKTLIVKSPSVILKVGAIGSVVTAESSRGQGLSTLVINDCLKAAEDQSCDVAILWSSLHEFYQKLNFELAGYELSFHIDHDVETPGHQFKLSSDKRVSVEAIHRLYNQHSVATVRNLDDTRKFLTIPETQVFTAWDQYGALAAYAIEGKGADLGNYVHEWGGSVSGILTLLQYIRETKKADIHLLVPSHSQNLMRALMAQNFNYHQGYIGLIRITQHDQLFGKIKRAFRAEGIADIVLEKRGSQFMCGIGPDFLIIDSEQDLIRLLFGPLEFGNLGLLKPETVLKLNKILPLPFWIWGWDSI